MNLANHYVLKNVGEYNEDYKVEQLHFHWGQSNAVGSEHLMKGKSYPLEVIFIYLYYIIYFKREFLFRCMLSLIQVYIQVFTKQC